MKRRNFINGAAAISGVTLVSPSIAFGTKANSVIRMGLIGCGNRGTTVMSSFLRNTNVQLIAMADLFEDRLQRSKKTLDEANAKKGLPAVEPSKTYLGSKAYQKLLDNKDVDVVQISSPCYSHPGFFEAAVNAGKHVYCEKPVAPDVDGCLRVIRAGEKANGKVSMAIGFQIRYASPYIEMVKRVQQGDIGDVLSVAICYLANRTGVGKHDGMSDDEARIRNHYNWLAVSGGPLLDQSIHIMDVCNWTLQKHPVKAFGFGGEDKNQPYGDVWRYFQVVYDYSGTHVSLEGSQYGPYFGDVCAKFIGTEGTAEAHYSGGVYISGSKPWDSGIPKCAGQTITDEQRRAGAFQSALGDADPNKEIAFIGSIEKGQFINETRSGAESTLSTILGRDAAMSGKEMTWDKLIASSARLDPKLNLAQFDK
jgi:myo-inositol 2-dehydrogenase / D-chiro-inositol 1-dehydrogenase